jgi:hypothetical protein
MHAVQIATMLFRTLSEALAACASIDYLYFVQLIAAHYELRRRCDLL